MGGPCDSRARKPAWPAALSVDGRWRGRGHRRARCCKCAGATTGSAQTGPGMMSRLLRLAIAFVRKWTRVYTARMSPELREARRAEIESDLWEVQQDRIARGD